jgi:hypothetical protein
MAGWQTRRRRMLGQILQAQGTRVVQQLTEQPSSGREWSQLGRELRIDAVVDEAAEVLALLVDDAQRPVAGVDEPAGGDDDTLQHRLEVEVLRDREDRLEQTSEPRVDAVHAPPRECSARVRPREVVRGRARSVPWRLRPGSASAA